jgi:hypothetical protein
VKRQSRAGRNPERTAWSVRGFLLRPSDGVRLREGVGHRLGHPAQDGLRGPAADAEHVLHVRPHGLHGDDLHGDVQVLTEDAGHLVPGLLVGVAPQAQGGAGHRLGRAPLPGEAHVEGQGSLHAHQDAVETLPVHLTVEHQDGVLVSRRDEQIAGGAGGLLGGGHRNSFTRGGCPFIYNAL